MSSLSFVFVFKLKTQSCPNYLYIKQILRWHFSGIFNSGKKNKFHGSLSSKNLNQCLFAVYVNKCMTAFAFVLSAMFLLHDLLCSLMYNYQSLNLYWAIKLTCMCLFLEFIFYVVDLDPVIWSSLVQGVPDCMSSTDFLNCTF